MKPETRSFLAAILIISIVGTLVFGIIPEVLSTNTPLPTGKYTGTIDNIQINYVQFIANGKNYTLDFSGFFVSCDATFKLGAPIQVTVYPEWGFSFLHYGVINGTQLGASGWPNSNLPTCDLNSINGFRYSSR